MRLMGAFPRLNTGQPKFVFFQ